VRIFSTHVHTGLRELYEMPTSEFMAQYEGLCEDLNAE
jgi:hypothetical protein